MKVLFNAINMLYLLLGLYFTWNWRGFHLWISFLCALPQQCTAVERESQGKKNPFNLLSFYFLALNFSIQTLFFEFNNENNPWVTFLVSFFYWTFTLFAQIQIPLADFHSAHLRFTFSHCTRHESRFKYFVHPLWS